VHRTSSAIFLLTVRIVVAGNPGPLLNGRLDRSAILWRPASMLDVDCIVDNPRLAGNLPGLALTRARVWPRGLG
jgi:hypothetical protein